MKRELLKLAEKLDESGLYSEADVVSGLLKKLSGIEVPFDFSDESDEEKRKRLYDKASKSSDPAQILISKYNMPLFSRREISMIQDALNSAGFMAGSVDGKWGGRTDAAFKDAVWAFSLLAAESERTEIIDTAPNSKLYNIALEIAGGGRPTEVFSLDLVLSMLRIIRDERARGTDISKGRPIKNYVGSSGSGKYKEDINGGESALVSTNPGGAERMPK